MEDEDKEYCVYVHTNKINKKMYVGQTCKKPEYRWRSGEGYVRHPYFYNAIQKYGWDNFDHEIIASHLTKSEADNFEKLLINKLDTMNHEFGYNLKEGGSHGRLSEEARKNMSKAQQGKKMPEEAKQKIREANIGKHHTKEAKEKVSIANKGRFVGANNVCAKKVRQYNKDGDLIKVWDCMSDASRELNISVSNISACCRFRLPSAGGFVWRYDE